jgi:hypothetical protein
MSDVTNGKGGVLAVDDTATKYTIDPVASNGGGTSKTAMTLKFWNEGASTIFVIVNAELADYAEADAVPIPSGKSFWFYGQPMKKFVIACASGETSTANFGAY